MAYGALYVAAAVVLWVLIALLVQRAVRDALTALRLYRTQQEQQKSLSALWRQHRKRQKAVVMRCTYALGAGCSCTGCTGSYCPLGAAHCICGPCVRQCLSPGSHGSASGSAGTVTFSGGGGGGGGGSGSASGSSGYASGGIVASGGMAGGGGSSSPPAGQLPHLMVPRSASRSVRVRSGQAGMAGFDERGSTDFALAPGRVLGLRQWSLMPPDLSGSPLDTGWEPQYITGATGKPWTAGVFEAVCSRNPAHQPPVDVDPAGQDCGCVSPETRILTADLRWVPAGDLNVGEQLLAFDEYPADPGYRHQGGRKYRGAVVASTDRGKLPCYDLQFHDGTAVRVSADHRWLCYAGQKGARWVRTDELRAGDIRISHVVKPFIPWETSVSREAGYLAAAFDGEGSLTQSKSKTRYVFHVSFAQSGNPMLAETEQCLKTLDISYNHYTQLRSYQAPRVDGTPRLDMHRLTIANRPEMIRFLGSVRPARLLPKFQPGLLGRLNTANRVRLVNKTFVGEREVVKLGTTSGTYFAEGLASHNCGCWAYWSPAGMSDWSTRGQLPLTGIIEGTGRVLIGEKGFRCQRAKIVALSLSFRIQPVVQGSPDTVPEGELAQAQVTADAWMAVIEDRVGLLFPGVAMFATVKGMLATYILGEKFQ